ncbi:MAG: glycosyltransferase family 39 protein [Ferruginibacter sp.]
MGLMPQDAYYYFYSQHPALSYFDHPPAIAWLLRIFTTLLGKHVFVLKLTDTIVSLLSLFVFYYLARHFLSLQRATNAVILFFSTLMFTILSLISTPDVPLILFWCLSLLVLYHAIFLQKKYYWIWAGIMMGLAFDSKYTAIFLPAGTALFLMLSNKYRKHLSSPWPWLAALCFIITISPVIIWNVQSNFASFKFQSSQRAGSISLANLNPVSFLGVIAHQSAILIPILFSILIVVVYKYCRKYIFKRLKISAEKLFLLCFFIPVFFGFFAVSFIYWIKLNWMMPAYISGIILVSMYTGRRLIRYQLLFSLVIHLVLAVEVFFYPVNIKSDDTWEGWDKLATEVQNRRSYYPTAFIFAADDYKTSAILNFYLPEFVYSVNVLGAPALQFDYIGTNLNALKGKDALYINSVPRFKNEQQENLYPDSLPAHFTSITQLEPILIKKNGKTILKFLVFLCKNYLPPSK